MIVLNRNILLSVLTAASFTFFFQDAQSQTFSYSADGTTIKAASERIKISVDTIKPTRSGTVPITLPGVIGALVNVGVSVVKTELSKAEEKYAASYSAVYPGQYFLKARGLSNALKADLNIDSIHIKRELIFNDLSTKLVSEIVLVPRIQPGSGIFRLQVTRINILGSKAKVKKSAQLIDLTISIKLDGIWEEQAIPEKADSADDKEKVSERNILRQTTSKENPAQKISSTYKIATLGESTIVIAGVKPEGNVVLTDDNPYYSGWYQLLPATSLSFASPLNNYGIGNYTLTVTVKEANPIGLSAKAKADFFSNTSIDLEALLKQFFPSASK